MSSDTSTSPSGGDVPSESSQRDRATYQGASPGEEEVSLLDLLVVLARNKTLIARTVLVFTLLGVTYAVFAPEQYTSSARVVRETQANGGVSLPGGISPGMLSGLGISLGEASSGLTAQAFPDVLRSREVQLAVARDTFRFPDAERPMTFVEYIRRPLGPVGTVLKYTLKLPWTLKRTFGDAISNPPVPAGTTKASDPAMLSKAEDEALERIRDMVSTTIDQESGLMQISVTASGPRLAAALTQSFVDHLTTRVREIRTKKVRQRLEFVNKRFREAKESLEQAEDRLAEFLEQNKNPNSAQLQFQRDRLQRQVRFKEQLYNDLRSQLTQARLDLQRQQPVVTVVEKPVPPTERSAPVRTLIVLVSLGVGILCAIGLAFTKAYFDEQQGSEERRKLEEIRNSLAPVPLFEYARKYMPWSG